MCVAALALGLLLVVEVAYVARLVLCRIHCLERTMRMLNDQQTAALTAAVAQVGTDLDELATRLEQAPVDDPEVTAVIEALRGTSARIDSLATSPETPPEPV